MVKRAPEVTEGDLERFRGALESEIHRTTLRAVARAVRMSPSGLQKFLRRESKPYGGTLARVQAWYYGQAGVHRTPPELIAAELRRYVATTPRPDRGVGTLLDAVDTAYREAGMFAPEWVRSVRAIIEERAGVSGRKDR